MKESGIIKAEIYNIGNRLFLLIDTNDKFTEENKKNLDLKNPLVQKWESLMSNYQKKIEFSKTNDKWVKMDKIFEL